MWDRLSSGLAAKWAAEGTAKGSMGYGLARPKVVPPVASALVECTAGAAVCCIEMLPECRWSKLESHKTRRPTKTDEERGSTSVTAARDT